MSSKTSVSQWVGQYREGDRAAAQPLVERYFHQLIELARQKLRGRRLALGDEEDLANSAMNSFFRGVECGRFPRLQDRNDLWQILVMLTQRKAARLLKHEARIKRGAGVPAEPLDPDQIFDKEPSPEFAAMFAEECKLLLGLLDPVRLRPLALLKMEGHTNEEIAEKLACNKRTVERKLKIMRSLWQRKDRP